MLRSGGRSFELDEALKVVTERGEGYLDDSAHTFRGLFGVWYPHLHYRFSTSLSDITSMSDDARVWIDGFLAGNEPGPEEFLGIDGDVIEPTDEELERWYAFQVRFRKTGACPNFGRRPTVALLINADERAQIKITDWTPWAFAGERVWVPSGDSWVEPNPQPPVDEFGFAEGSVCTARGHHDLLDIDSGWQVCQDCGQVEPD